jgi:hypothetical protein
MAAFVIGTIGRTWKTQLVSGRAPCGIRPSIGEGPDAQGPRQQRATATRLVCCTGVVRSTEYHGKEPPHPWGNGGLENVANLEGYDAEKQIASFAEEKAAFAAWQASQVDDEGVWAVVYNADMIMWDNNLIEANMKDGLKLQLDGLRAFRVVELIVQQQCFEEKVDALWVLECTDGGLLSVTAKSVGRMIFSYEKKDDAERFAMTMAADDRGDVKVKSLPLQLLKDVCKAQGALIGLIAPSFVQPHHFSGNVSQLDSGASL